jgi:hypothetical protein
MVGIGTTRTALADSALGRFSEGRGAKRGEEEREAV